MELPPKKYHSPSSGLKPPPGKGRKGKQGRGKKQDLDETAAHAKEVRERTAGRDKVEERDTNPERRPAPFDRQELFVVRSWFKNRPLEPMPAAAALVPYPRMWTTKRGRYCQFRAGRGVFALVRARPTF